MTSKCTMNAGNVIFDGVRSPVENDRANYFAILDRADRPLVFLNEENIRDLYLFIIHHYTHVLIKYGISNVLSLIKKKPRSEEGKINENHSIQL